MKPRNASICYQSGAKLRASPQKERAALGWTEALTRLSEGPDHQSAYQRLQSEFTEEEQVKITLLINVINGFNRIAVGFGLYAEPAEIREAVEKYSRPQ